MTVDVIILGAKGRMGTMLANQVKADQGLRLAGVCERPGNCDGLEGLDCLCGDDLEALLPQLPGAVIIDFTSPASSVAMAEIAARHGNPAVIGTTGLDKNQQAQLAECMAEARGWVYDDVKKHCRDGIIGERPHKEIGVQTLRGGDVVGEHTMSFFGTGERIEVTHRAHSRETFAAGALRAAKWLSQQGPGKLYSMADIF